MWNSLSSFIIKFRVLFLILIAGVTLFMAQNAVNVEYSVERAKILPSSHQVYLDNQNFQNKYGNNQVMAIAISDSLFFNIDRFLFWDSLCTEIKKIKGVENIISVNNLSKLEKNSEEKKFETSKWFDETQLNQETLDSLVVELNKQKFYDGFFNDNNDGALVLIDLDSEIVISKNRDNLVFSIKEISEIYSKKYNIRIHYSGMPYMRSVQSVSLKKEIILFVFLTLLITSLILYLFFRSFKAMFVSVIVVVLGVIFAFGFIEILDYKITLLTALVPPVLIVIGIPNCIFLINKFHNEYRKNNNKIKSLKIMIGKIGNITLLTNITTATGFAAFLLTNSQSLQEFGLIA